MPEAAPDPSRKLIWHPFLVAILPVLSTFAANQSLISLRDLVRPTLILLALSGLVWSALRLLLRGWDRAAMATSTLFAASFFYHALTAPVKFMFGSTVLLVTFSAGLLVAMVVMSLLPKLNSSLNVFSGILIVLTLGNAVFIRMGNYNLAEKSSSLVGTSKVGPKPDIFYIILDGYGREDVLRRKFGFDNASFINQLWREGFFVANKGTANYCQTELSLSSSLNFDYLPKLLPGIPKNTEQRFAFDKLIQENQLTKNLSAVGYEFSAVLTGFPAIQFPGQDLSQLSREGMSMLETALIDRTPFGDNSTVAEGMFANRREWINRAFNTLKSMNGPVAKPRFVFAHILAPHPPFVFGPNGEPKQPNRGFGYWDGSDFFDRGGTRKEYETGYTGQVAYLNSQLIPMIKALKAQARPPIIILQGDHGPKSGLAQNSLEGTDVTECFPNLQAIFVPNGFDIKFPEDLTPVNTFRIIQNRLLGQNLPILQSRNFYSPFAKPMLLTDVTDKLK